MISRGLDGAAVDWYGPDSYEALGVKLLLTEAEAHPGFSVFVEVDKGAIEWDSCYPGCNATTAATQLFTRVAGDFFSSPAYARIGGRPLLREFGMETLSMPSGQTDSSWNQVDWNAVQAQVPGNPLILHRNLGGFDKPLSGGAFAWMEPKTTDKEPANYDGTDELNWFYSNAVAKYASRPAFGAAWKGFNDILAGWAPPGGRHIEQNCGQTWLRTFDSINHYYSAANPLTALQLITWNDYEEGTELETGIDNCVSLSASLSGNQLQWSLSGEESTLDHDTVFISTDGENLAPLGNFALGSRSVDLSGFSLPAGSYSLFVQAVGKPSLRNQMSEAVSLTVAPSPTSPPSTKDVTIAASPSSAQITRGQAGQFTLSVAQTGAADPVSFSCSNLPAGARCAFSPASVTPGAQPVSVGLAISTSAMTAAARPLRPSPLFAFWMPGAFGLVLVPELLRRRRHWSFRERREFLSGLSFAQRREFLERMSFPDRREFLEGVSFREQPARRFSWRKLLLFMVLAFALLQLACGGGHVSPGSSTPSPTAQPTATNTGNQSETYTITVTATSGSMTRSTNVTLTVN
jgi:hypothetical protein